MTQHIFISAGDASGEIHAANLVCSIKKAAPDTFVTALGGKCLREAADSFAADLVSLSAFGFLDPVRQYSRLRRIFNEIRQAWDVRRPDRVVLVDYYGFHIHVAEEASRRGIPVYYYISPQVWASRPGRIAKLGRFVKKMLVILPFEEAIYRKAGVDAVFVGHPLIDMVPGPALPQDGGEPVIGLFPGSRPGVVRRHLRLMADAAISISERTGARFQIFGLPGREELYRSYGFPVVAEEGYRERKNLTLAITVSGTVSLENALLGIPMVVMYRLSALNYLLARALIRIPYITMANILAGERIVPELIQGEATAENIAAETMRILADVPHRELLREQLIGMRRRLGEPGVSDRAARIILKS